MIRNPARLKIRRGRAVARGGFIVTNIPFGCNVGVILSGFKRMGKEVLGVDVSAMAERHALIDKKKFVRFGLRRAFISEKRFDLCICLEVAEHIEERYSDVLLGSITRASPNVLFSAAPPEQSADCHFNLKPRDRWIKKFGDLNFIFDERATSELQQRFRRIPNLPHYYIANVMVFRKRGV